MIERETRGPVALLTMNFGKGNTLDLESLEDLSGALRAEAEGDMGAVVLTGTGRIFSAGVDLFKMLDGGASYVGEVIPAFASCLRTAFTFPKPLVAALNGHAIAGGCILALATDYRIGSEGSGRIGVPELDFGVPLPPTLFEIVRHAVPRQHQHEVIYRGGTYYADQALELGLLDESVPPHSLLHRAVEEARLMAGINPAIFRITKAQQREPVLRIIDEGNRLYDEEAIQIIAADDTMDAIRDYMDRTVGRRA